MKSSCLRLETDESINNDRSSEMGFPSFISGESWNSPKNGSLIATRENALIFRRNCLEGDWTKSPKMGCSCRNLIFQLTRDFSGGDFFVQFFRVATPQRRLLAGRVCIPYTHSSRCWPLREINSKVQKMGDPGKNDGPPWGENLERNEFGSRRGLFRSRDI